MTWPLPERCASSSPRQQPDRQQHAAAAEVAHQVQRRHGRLALAADVRQAAGQGDVVDVVAGALRVGALLAPPGHAPVDEAGIARQADVGAEAEPLHHPRPEALEQRVGLLDQPEHGLHTFGHLDVDGDRLPAAGEQVFGRHRWIGPVPDVGGPIDADDPRRRGRT